MPGPSPWMLRAALMHALLGFGLGALLLANKGFSWSVWLWQLLPFHIDALLFGFAAQLAMGVAFWLLPRHFEEPRYGRVKLVWASFAGLNLGVLATGLSAVVPGWADLRLAARGLELLACVSFAIHAWPRIKPFMDVGAGAAGKTDGR